MHMCKRLYCLYTSLPVEIIIDLPIGFPINNMISLSLYRYKPLELRSDPVNSLSFFDAENPT